MHGHATWSWHALWPRLVFDGKWASCGSLLWRPVHTWRSGRCRAFCFFQTSDILAWLLQNCNYSITQCDFAPFEIKCDCRFGATRNMSQLLGEKHTKPTLFCAVNIICKRTIHVFIWVQDSKNYIYKQQITLKFLCVFFLHFFKLFFHLFLSALIFICNKSKKKRCGKFKAKHSSLFDFFLQSLLFNHSFTRTPTLTQAKLKELIQQRRSALNLKSFHEESIPGTAFLSFSETEIPTKVTFRNISWVWSSFCLFVCFFTVIVPPRTRTTWVKRSSEQLQKLGIKELKKPCVKYQHWVTDKILKYNYKN